MDAGADPCGFDVQILRTHAGNGLRQAGQDGSFQMRDVAPGDYDVVEGYTALGDDLYISDIRAGDEDALSDGIHVGDGPVGTIKIILMANAGGAWDIAKKIVETELKQKGTALHAATVVGNTVGDPFKDTSSVALNPIIKFTTLFGLLAVELAVALSAANGSGLSRMLSAIFLVIALVFIWRTFYRMRMESPVEAEVSFPTAHEQKPLVHGD